MNHIQTVFHSAGIEVKPVKSTHDQPWGEQKQIECHYAGRFRITNPEVCQWHGERRDILCVGCPRATWIVKPATRVKRQSNLFR